MSTRKNFLQKKIKEQNLDGLILKNEVNRFYLTGVNSSYGWVLLSKSKSYFLVDSRYIIASQAAAKNFEVVESNNFKDWWSDFCKNNPRAKIGFESHDLTHQQLLSLRNWAKPISPRDSQLKLVPTNNLIESLREIKDEKEVALIKKSLQVAESVFKEALKIIRPGQTELEIAWQLEKLIREKGGESSSWYPFIVAVGKNSAEPHHHPNETKIKKGDLVQLDFGAVVGGYHSDISRVVFMGKPSEKQKRIYRAVLEVQEFAKSLIKPGVVMGEVDKKAREFLHKEVGREGVYRHSLGHGVGLEVHEAPTIHSGVKEKFKVRQVVTIEPAIYLPGWGGIRLEDEVLVTREGAETLNKSLKQISQVII